MNNIGNLIRRRVIEAHMRGGCIDLKFDGREIRDQIVRKVVAHGAVGNWDRRRNVVYVDRNIKDSREIKSLAIHEAVEKELAQVHRLNPFTTAHRVAGKIEDRWDIDHRIPIRKYQQDIDDTYHKRLREMMYKRKK